MKRPSLAFVAGLALALFAAPACGDKAKSPVQSTGPAVHDAPPAAADAAEPAIQPAQVIATVQLPSGSDPGEIASAIDALQPGMGAMVGAQLPTMLREFAGCDLAGADVTKPVSLVVVDPKRFSRPTALLVVVRDAKALQAAAEQAGQGYRAHGDRALVGPPDVVAASEAFAFDTLGPAPGKAVVTLYVRTIAALFQTELEAAGAQLRALMSSQSSGVRFASLLDSYVAGFRALVAQTDRIEITLAARPPVADLLMEIHPLADTTLAAFVAAQEPSAHGLIAMMPPSDKVGFALSGSLRAGGARDALLSAFKSWMAAAYGAEIAGEEMDASLASWMAALDGECAMVMPSFTSGMKMSMLMATHDAAAARNAWREWMALIAGTGKAGRTVEVMGIKATHTFKAGVATHAKTPIDRYVTTTDLASIDPAMRPAFEKLGAETVSHIAVLPAVAAMTMGDKNGKAIRRLLDAARKGKHSKLPPGLQAVLDDSKARQESMVMYMDIAALVGSSVPDLPVRSATFGMGRHDSVLALRISVAGKGSN